MQKTIKSKMIIATISFILLIIVLPSLFLAGQYEKNFLERSREMIITTVYVVIVGLENNMVMGAHPNIQETITQLSANGNIKAIRLFDSTGIVLHATDSIEIDKNITSIIEGKHIIDQLNEEEEIIRLLDMESYSVVKAIENRPVCQECHEEAGQNIAYIDIDTHFTKAEQYFFTGARHIYYLGLVMIIVLIAGIYLFLQIFISKPLELFIGAMDEVEGGNLEVTLPADKKDEVGILETHFNHMVNKLKVSNETIEELHYEQLQRADKLVTLGELAAEMAHEVNNPTGIIMSRADYLDMEAEENSNLKKYRNDLSVIFKQTEKISKITGSILKYGRKHETDFKEVRLTQICEESLKLLEPRIKKNKIVLKTQFEDSDPVIWADPLQMEQVLTNLINNAIDALSEEGELILTIKSENNQIDLIIKDDGSGIPKDIQDKMFSPFFTTRSDGNGTGLGLYIVKNICKNHQAEIKVHSQMGRGTEITISFNEVSNEL